MDAFVKVIKPNLLAQGKGIKVSQNSQPHILAPSQIYDKEVIDLTLDENEDPSSSQSVSRCATRSVTAKDTKQLLRSLKDNANPITHSRIYDRSDHISSCSSGHQRAESSHTSSYFKERSRKLASQQCAKTLHHGSSTNSGTQSPHPVMRGVRAYLGYCDETTDVEMRRVIALAGGTVTYNESSATHIVTSQWLSGSKTQKKLSSQKKFQVVSPEWVFESVEKGKRQNEWRYTKVQSIAQNSVLAFVTASSAPSK